MQFINDNIRAFQLEGYSQFIIGARSIMEGDLVWIDSTHVLYDNIIHKPDHIQFNECVAVDLIEDNWFIFNCDDNLSANRGTLCQAGTVLYNL